MEYVTATGTVPSDGGAEGTIRGLGVVLRPWSEGDAADLVELYDTEEMDRWTPIAHPFGPDAAKSYLARSIGRRDGVRQFAITEDGDRVLGEALLLPTDEVETCELGYALKASCRGRSLASRSVRLLLRHAGELGFRRARLRIVVGNEASDAVARATGFAMDPAPPVVEERKGYVVRIATWWRPLG